jgi:hypothetical protein
MGVKSRRKGARAEREVATLLRESGCFPNARRNVTAVESQGVALGVDVSGTPGLAVQVECAKVIHPERKLWEAIDYLMSIDIARYLEDATPGTDVPVAFCRRSPGGIGWTVTMRASDFIGLWRRAHADR